MNHIRSFLVLIFFCFSSSHAFLTEADRKVLAANYLTSTCGCRDYHFFCPFLYNQCSSKSQVRLMCPLSCALCVACPAEINPTLSPTPKPCEFGCSDLSPPVLCAWFKTRLFCPFTKSLCRETCEECNRCVIPPATPPPCREECGNQVQEKNCIFWKSRGFCNAEGDYPNVPYLCQVTCEVCTKC